ncbi:hypothetical protein [Streptomyces asiaticus]|uniref:hypothetical protein n=1 Tax=Streptomyces asiaticus TaxID=114695 RepID=UPI003F66F6EB
MARFGKAPALAAEEQARGEGLTARIVQISSDPSNPSNGSLPLYQQAARAAFETAAEYGEQPETH